jgi:hypothetical protein
MGYRFNGFFAQADQHVLQTALKHWPFCRGRSIEVPFSGIGLICPDPNRADTDEAAEIILEQIAAVEEGLPAWSKQFPTITFVYLQADCAGGNCLYDGYVCRDGFILAEENSTGQSLLESRTGLSRLLQWLNVHSRTASFAPLERGFFDRV